MLINKILQEVSMDYKERFRHGLVEMLLLKVLSEQDCYGYQITQIMKNVSKGAITVREGSMYPILYKLQEKGYISSYKGKGNGRMERIYYHIEESGLEELEKLIAAYNQVHEGVVTLLNYQHKEEADVEYAK